MTDSIFCFWPRSPAPGNMGDVWTPYLLRELCFHPSWVHPTASPKLLSTGSIVRFGKTGDTIWGSGLIDANDAVCSGCRYVCVRGPVTGQRCGCEVYGDPALLAPLFIDPAPKRAAEVTVIPHYVHLGHNDLRSFDVISPLTATVGSTVGEISSCNSVLSSSLHGIIFAHAYGIAAGWWRPDNALTGDDVKFEDYAQSVNICLTPAKTLSKVNLTLPSYENIQRCQKNLIDSVPLWSVR